MARTGRVLAIDSGEARHGLALSDPLGITAQPLDPLPCVGPRKDVERLAQLIVEREVQTVVVGLPLLLSGEEGTSALRARELARRLQDRLEDVRVELWDERLSTVEAERTLLSGGVRRKRRREVIDTLAAVLILQSFLDARAAGHVPDP